ncbi:MAG: NAD(P)-dependent alcohol dehydrogenase [SAR324 cluster bacterium]|jgi:NADPH:quinone reductase-like Zn-dependent oxidoreductase|nr:NAD(P)-dependent alcohol dehydrogenase [Deltaproteobacteria bacterium]MDP6093626.1 NAD(P)-dependent alcohol dehydrogenase [SAR324 cluster bacterium]MDP6247999.1 NAD(P)-dependent alcohol dehydrogenase [SAR324 cluster bacterium]MDP6330805.1 NAD(P)-dependent alcohol dehydrogenase [SAR324 cluster bacterium]MDP6465653.1 NAD(P)-dependent alcohol dehydrogenase [SAR324 cluster bacterium]|tara:strand:- start:2698 stop:3711 length:1014 start_codon:yes stop_codon:yes gene_type:complete
MKAYQIRDEWSLEHIELVEIPKPSPGPGEVLVEMKASSLNYRDMVVANRGYGSKTGNLPLIPVSDGVGIVRELGDGVSRVAIGDRICPLFMQGWISGPPNRERLSTTLGGPIDGVMAEFRCFPQDSVSKVPEELTDLEASTLPCAALTAWSALVEEGKLQPGESVLIQGTGGVSLFALQFAKICGARCILISGSNEKMKRAQELGADEVLNYQDLPEWGKQVRDFSGGEGVDHIVEVGGPETLPQSLRAIRPGGTISMIGVLSGSEMKAQLGLIVTRQIRLQGITVGHRDGFEAMASAINASGMKPIVDQVYPFTSLPEAMHSLSEAKHFGKICLEF